MKIKPTPPTQGKSYRAPIEVIRAIKQLAPDYGSQGRLLQVATELLIRSRRPVTIPKSITSASVDAAATYKLVPRTIELIDQLTATYGRAGDVLAACVQVLKEE